MDEISDLELKCIRMGGGGGGGGAGITVFKIGAFLADSLFMRIKPSLSDRFFISWRHNVLLSI